MGEGVGGGGLQLGSSSPQVPLKITRPTMRGQKSSGGGPTMRGRKVYIHGHKTGIISISGGRGLVFLHSPPRGVPWLHGRNNRNVAK